MAKLRKDTGRVEGIDYTLKAEREGKRYNQDVAHAKNVYKQNKSFFRRISEYFFGPNNFQNSLKKIQDATIEMKKDLKKRGLTNKEISDIVLEVKGSPLEPDINEDCVEYILDTYGMKSDVPVKRDELVLWITKQLVRESGTHYNVDIKGRKKGKYFLITSDIVHKKGDEEIHQVILKKLKGV